MELFDRIKQHVDIVDVVSQYVNLKKTGDNFKALCPFHNEKTPSFVVSSQKQIYHCFGCGKGGDVINFISEIEGVSNFDAALKLARDYNIPVDLKEKSGTNFFEILNFASDIFHKNLKNNLNNKLVKSFILKRKISDDIIDKFYLGYAPDSFNFLLKLLEKNKISLEVCAELGILKKKENFYDAFRNRIIFPIRNNRGEVIAFGGRILDDSLPKYLNSPESRIYHKRKNLYGLYENKEYIKQEKEAIIVEGYMDLISLYSFGIKNCVATLGTAFTEEQLNLLKRFTDNIIFLYDGDNAGVKAAIRGAIIAINNDCNAKLIYLPDEKDPDDFIKENGVKDFLRLKKKSYDLVNFLKIIIFQKINLNYLENKIKLINRLKNIYFAIDNPLYRDHFIKGMSEILELDYIELKNYFKKRASLPLNKQNTEYRRTLISIEDRLISIILNNRKYLDEINSEFLSEEYRNLIQIIKNYNNFNDMLKNDTINNNLKNKLRELLMLETDEKYFYKFYNKLKEIFLKNRLKELTQKIKKLEVKGLNEEILSLIKEKDQIKEQIKELIDEGGLA